MKRIDRYIITSYLGPMLLTFVIVLFVLVLQFIWLYIDEIIGKGLELSVILEFFFWGGVTFIPLSLPLSTMLASLMTMGSMGENNELLAMKAAGMSVKRIIRPLVGVAAIVSITAFLISNYLLPVAHLNISSLMSDIRHKRSEIKIPTGIFYNGIVDYSIRIERQTTNMMYNVILYDHTAQRGNNSVTRADSGYIRFTNDKQYLIFKLFDGYTYEDQQQNVGDTIYPFQKRNFTEQEVLIPLSGYEFKRGENDEWFKGQAKMKSLGTLGYESDSIRRQELTIIKDFSNNFAYRTNLMRSQEFDSLLLIKAQYAKSFAGDSLFNLSTDEEKFNAISAAADHVSRAVSQLDMHAASFEQYNYNLRRINIEWHRKFAMSIACLLFFFIGAPLGTIIRKGGLGVPAVISIFFFVLYWVVDISGVKLSRDGVWLPIIGMWLSSAVLLPLSIFITYKATTDSNLFNIDRYNIARYTKILKSLTKLLSRFV
ncbi:MAG: LptF/LptG family permease [Bacteroidales bacterium]|nr:LptF/LptG family permease [Bacteroidales bacterium]MCL2133716.1 LptF/LptG family permease [Bacteroidales bacterium]